MSAVSSPFIQDKESRSVRQNTFRGLHFQSEPHAPNKLVRCTGGHCSRRRYPPRVAHLVSLR
ncbi:dTDP-4-dehydrorhamnose 3,5-epimerase family protein [Sphingobium sp. YBL2]|uniref:dTDP-4-dehydrorhamnose 3,5-epimerase family protein n=1 Tax=Sphingobium sp. (strain YBL2) TaxID=484429 RepID=UPI001EE1C772|nr:dTDP-4-dehydrorhamnose 3,5-epimerase family protein [Sphingobium sp. YBL2]